MAWFGSRFQRDTSIAETRAATLRIQLEHAEKERQHRQGVYHRLLQVLNAQDAMMTGWAPLTEEAFQAWLHEFYALYQGIHLFGDQRVRDALGPLVDLLTVVGQDAAGGNPSLPFHERMRPGYGKRRTDIVAAEATLTEAMRASVAPEVTLPQLGAALEQQRLEWRDR